VTLHLDGLTAGGEPTPAVEADSPIPAEGATPPAAPSRPATPAQAAPPRPAVAAVALGWQVAELASALGDGSVEFAGRVLRAQPLVRTITFRLRSLGLEETAASLAGELAELLAAPDPDPPRIRRAVLELHAATLRQLDGAPAGAAGAAVDGEGVAAPPAVPRADLRRAYELGRALAQSALVATASDLSVAPSLYRRLFDSARLLTLAEWLALLRADLPEHAADATFHSLRCWCDYVARASDEQLAESAAALRSQGRIWRDLLFDRRPAVTLLTGGSPGPVAETPEEIETISLDAAFAAHRAGAELAPEEVAMLRAATVLPEHGVPSAAPGAPPAPAPAASPPTARRRWLERIGGWLVVLVLALVITVLLRSFVVQPFSIPSASMVPTLQVGDRILVDKLPWSVDALHLGDVVVFRRVPADRVDPQTEDLVKRIVGLPGETIWSRGDTVVLDGKPLAEPWLPALTGDCAESQLDIPRQTIPAGHYFMLGDCRGISYDSRYWGTVPASHVIGKVVVVVWRHGHPWFHWL
jgi:signal peptidase I